MTKRFIELWSDDIDGTEYDPATGGGETLVFEFDGERYAIDLNDDNATKFRQAMSPYIGAATIQLAPPQIVKTTGKKAKGSDAARDKENAEIRAWAAKEGIELPARGRIPAAVREQYAAK